MKINEIGLGAASADWVKLCNAGATPVLLDGWALSAGPTRYPLPPVVIPARGLVVLAPNEAFLHSYPAFQQPLAPLTAPLTLARQNGVAGLEDAGGNAVDVVAWGVPDGIFQRRAVPPATAWSAAPPASTATAGRLRGEHPSHPQRGVRPCARVSRTRPGANAAPGAGGAPRGAVAGVLRAPSPTPLALR